MVSVGWHLSMLTYIYLNMDECWGAGPCFDLCSILLCTSAILSRYPILSIRVCPTLRPLSWFVQYPALYHCQLLTIQHSRWASAIIFMVQRACILKIFMMINWHGPSSNIHFVRGCFLIGNCGISSKHKGLLLPRDGWQVGILLAAFAAQRCTDKSSPTRPRKTSLPSLTIHHLPWSTGPSQTK